MATKYWYGGSGTWTDGASHWSLNSGNSPASTTSTPTISDNAVFDANSASGNYTVTRVNGQVCHNITVSAPTGGNVTFSGGTGTITINGNLTFYSGMTWNTSVPINGGEFGITHDWTTAGVNVGNIAQVGGANSVIRFLDNVTCGSITLVSGGFNFNGKTVTCGNILSGANTFSKSLVFGSATVSCTTLDLSASTGGTVTITANTSSLTITGATLWLPASKTLYDVTFTGSGIKTITGGITFNSLTLEANQTVKFADGSTTTVSSLTANGTSGNLVTLRGTSTGGWTIAKSGGGTVALDYVSVTYSTGSPGSTWSAGANSTDAGNNTGWTFSGATTFRPVVMFI